MSLTAGIVLIAFGTILLLASAGLLRLNVAAMAPVVFGTVGAVLLASGLSRSASGRG